MPKNAIGGLRSDGELVQGNADVFEFLPDASDAREGDNGHDAWIDVISVGPPISRAGGDPDDDGLPDIIVWCIDGDGSGATGGREDFMLTYEIASRTWAVNGEVVDDAGMSALLFL